MLYFVVPEPAVVLLTVPSSDDSVEMSWLLNVLPVTLYFSIASSAVSQSDLEREATQQQKKNTGQEVKPEASFERQSKVKRFW